MNRPWIEFIQAQVLPWQDGLYGSGRADVESTILSQDTELRTVRRNNGHEKSEIQHFQKSYFFQWFGMMGIHFSISLGILSGSRALKR